MIKKLKPVFLIAILAALIGGAGGVVTAGFLHFVEWGQDLLWKVVTPNLPLQSLLLCTLGGLLVGLCQRFLGDHPDKNLNEAVSALIKTGRLEYHHLPQGLANISASLIFGASLGPEAAIVDLLGGLGTWVGDTIRFLRKRFNLPRPDRPKNRLTEFLHGWPNLIALVVAAIAFVKLLGGMYSGGFLNPGEPFRWTNLLWSIPLGLVGAAGGWLFLALQTWTQKLVAPIRRKPILCGTLSGFALGLIALFLPLVLFSGQHFLQSTYNQAVQLGGWILLLTALARLFLTNLLLASGWKGGQFLPMIFGGAALGLSVSALFPAVPSSVAALGAMGALVAVVLPQPLIALVLMVLMFPLQYAGISIVSVGLVMMGKRLWPKFVQRSSSLSQVPASED
jgi:H+/Cl- antiporter ClcA